MTEPKEDARSSWHKIADYEFDLAYQETMARCFGVTSVLITDWERAQDLIRQTCEGRGDEC